MKTIIFLFPLFLFFNSHSQAQLQFESTINSKFKTVKLENGSLKTYSFDAKMGKLRLYNLDNSVWKEVDLAIDKNSFFDDILLVSKKTINTDSAFEIIYTTIEYTSIGIEENSEMEFDGVRFDMNIINEKGEKILSVPNSNVIKIATENGHNKLLVYKNTGHSFTNDNEILVYALPQNK